MHGTQHPSHFAPELLPEYLDLVCQEVISVAYQALADASTPHDTAYTRATLLYGRLQGLCKALGADLTLPWLELRNGTMDFTISINGVLLQIVTDDPDAPKKLHRLKANLVELHQLSLFEASPDVSTWRLFVDGNNDLEFPEFKATIVGFDFNKNILCQWTHEYKASVPVRTSDLPAQVEIEEPLVVRRNKDANTKKPEEPGSVDGR
ncbi:hypothetical protein [Pseudomonas sivasensis]|uniref:hypothetical protein n=1 Tax=Pseudomonas sivasensis TaxID=1880678 RepID=UPI003B9EDC0E